MTRTTPPPPGFRAVPRTGVIYVMNEAAKAGYTPDSPLWANLGQGAPETGPLADGTERVTRIDIGDEHEYAPVGGLLPLREAVAELYNARYRVGKASQYTADNVAICAGGRLGLTRLVSTLGRTHLGHFLPDYTAYEELLSVFGTFVPIPILLDPERQYAFSPQQLRDEILGRGLGALLLSNPCNPTGKLLHGETLSDWVRVCSELQATLIVDEFYSHYIYTGDALTASAAAYVEDVDEDPVVILDGLTKNWRYPGWRVSWTVGPKAIIEAVTSAGSFIDGGCARPMQLAALPLVRQDVADREARSIQAMFRRKRRVLIEGLEELGLRLDIAPQGGFYCWAELSRLPPSIRTGMKFFRRALEYQVICVPGEFFDINPGQRRSGRPSRFRSYVRFSFGPSLDVLERGVASLRRMIAEAE